MKTKKLLSLNNGQDENLLGWESIVNKWHLVNWPRRPSFLDIAKLNPLIELASGNVGIFGATPEYRFTINKFNSSLHQFLIEKSELSYKAMTEILKTTFNTSPNQETLIKCDWEEISKEIPKKSFNLLMGDTILGYLKTKEKILEFLESSYNLLIQGGKFVLREFIFEPINYTPKEIRHLPYPKDLKRWCYIFSKKFALSDGIFYEEKLANNLLKIGDIKVYRTCADPPRVRILLTFNEFETLVKKSGFELDILDKPNADHYPHPGIFVLKKSH